MTETYVATVNSLGVNSFPERVSTMLDQLAWKTVSAKGLKRVVRHSLGVEIPEYFETIVRTRDWHNGLDRQLLGTICTFLHIEEKHDLVYEELGDDTDRYVRFVVQKLPNKREISLIYPGYKNRFDFDLRVDDWYTNTSIPQSPRHWHLFSDFFWKYKQVRAVDSTEDVPDELSAAIEAIFVGRDPREVIGSIERDVFTVGRTLNVLLGILPWFFMEEEINYPYTDAEGKEMPFRVLRELGSIQPGSFTRISDNHCEYADPNERHEEYHRIMAGLENYSAKLQDNCDIIETPHSIKDSCP